MVCLLPVCCSSSVRFWSPEELELLSSSSEYGLPFVSRCGVWLLRLLVVDFLVACVWCVSLVLSVVAVCVVVVGFVSRGV